MEEVHQPSELWVLFTKSRPSTPTSFSKQSKGSNSGQDSSSLHRNVTARKNKRKKKSYAEVVKDKISERKEDKEKTLAIEYNKNDEKQENVDNAQNRKTKIDLDQNFDKSDEDLVNILTDLEPSIESVSNFDTATI